MNISSELRALEEQLLQTSVRHNRKAVAELLAEDFREFGSSGRVWNKQQILDHLETEPPFTAVIRDFQSTELAAGAILVTYTVTVQLPETEGRESLRSSIWMKRNGQWQMIFHQGTPVAGK